MDASQAMREMVEASGLTHRQLERRCNRYSGWVGQTLARPRPGADLLAEIARACGWRLELVPMDGSASICVGDYSATDETETDQIALASALLARASDLLRSASRSHD